MNGKVVASDVVSMFLVISSLSRDIGKVDLKPSSWERVACLGTISKEPRVDSTSFDDLFSSSIVSAGIET